MEEEGCRSTMHAEDDESFFSSGSESAVQNIEQTSGGSSSMVPVLSNLNVLQHSSWEVKRGIITHVQPPVSQVVRLASRLSSETPTLGKDRQGMFVD